MGIKELLNKAKAMFAQKQNTPTRKITNEEFELGIYKERERQEKIRTQVSHYRKLEGKKMFEDRILREKPTLFKQKNIIKNNGQPKILGGRIKL